MKAIYMMVLGFAFIGNAMAVCPQEMGYLAPEDMLPACDSTAQSQPVPSSMQTAMVKQATSAKVEEKVEEMCPQDIGYLAPTEMLPPCSGNQEKSTVAKSDVNEANDAYKASSSSKKADATTHFAKVSIYRKESP